MRSTLITSILLLISVEMSCQLITGRVIDSGSTEPLEYVNIGIVNTHFGTITDENGYFKMEDTKGY